MLNVRDHGAAGNGTTDDTAAIESAWRASNGNIYLPAGDYVYTGAGLPYRANEEAVLGDGPNITNIMLAGGSRFLNHSTAVRSFRMSGLRTIGGAGAFRSTFTGNAVAYPIVFEDCIFQGYTATAIEHNANDSPYWKINRCVFDAANFTTTMGVALSGLTDGTMISDCEFLKNRVHVKLRNGGGNGHIHNCDLIRFGPSEGEPRIGVWLVPTDSAAIGRGFTCEISKFGPENTEAGDIHILYANELPGTTNGERFPDLVTVNTTSGIENHTVRSCSFGANRAGVKPIYSMVSRIMDSRYQELDFAGVIPDYVLEYAQPPAPGHINPNTVGPVYANTRIGSAPVKASNAENTITVDPNGTLAATPDTITPYPVGDPVGYRQLYSTAVDPIHTPGADAPHVTITPTADVHGGQDARKVTATGRRSIYGQLATPTPGQNTWIEFDAKAGTTTRVGVRVRSYTGGTTDHFEREADLGQGWARYRFLWTPAAAPAGAQLLFHTPGTGDFTLGRVRVYQSREPLNVDGVTVIGGIKYRLDVDRGLVFATPA